MPGKYDKMTREALIALLEDRDEQRPLGLVWERDPDKIGRDQNITDHLVTVLPDGSRFFPDFIVSAKGRQKPDGILLVDTKRAVNDDHHAIPKTIVAHAQYGRAMILKKDGHRWLTIRYSEQQDKNLEDQVLHPELLAHFV